LGRSYGLILAAEALKEDLACILRLFHHNAAALALPLRVRTPDQLPNEISYRTPDNSHFPDLLERLAGTLEELLERLNEYGEYTVRIHSVFPFHRSSSLSQNESAHLKKLMGLFAIDLVVRQHT
jgi:hypothetical protein